MKITKLQLKQIIKEEFDNIENAMNHGVLQEEDGPVLSGQDIAKIQTFIDQNTDVNAYIPSKLVAAMEPVMERWREEAGFDKKHVSDMDDPEDLEKFARGERA